MKKNKIECKLTAGFVDGIRFFLKALRRGAKYNKETKEVYVDKDQETKDHTENTSGTEITRRIIHKIINTITRKHLKFTTETHEMFQNGRLPTLDTEMWVGVGESGEQKLFYGFYSKPTASPYTIIETSALPQQTKQSSLSQEVVRRMLNITPELKEERKTVVEQFDSKLKASGY